MLLLTWYTSLKPILLNYKAYTYLRPVGTFLNAPGIKWLICMTYYVKAQKSTGDKMMNLHNLIHKSPKSTGDISPLTTLFWRACHRDWFPKFATGLKYVTKTEHLFNKWPICCSKIDILEILGIKKMSK